ncbi:MAG: Ig-like domain-containing protein [Candidatus Thiodiazotropha sp.]
MHRQLLDVVILACMFSLSGVVTGADGGDATKPPQPAHDHRGEKRIVLENGYGAIITLWKPDLSTQQLTLDHDAVTIPMTGIDNYHAIVAEKDWGDHKEAVIRYEYRFGRPSKQSPSRLAAKQKTEFEIVPDPIPREHYRYHSLETWDYLVRFNGKPVNDLEVILNTDNGSQLSSTTDSNGRVSFQIPDDFPGMIEGERDKRLGQFTVSSEYLEGDRRYTTRLNADYRVNPAHWQSTRLGLLVVGIGFIAGGFLGRVNRSGGKVQ